MTRWMPGLLAVLFSATLAVAQQQPTTPVTTQHSDIPQGEGEGFQHESRALRVRALLAMPRATRQGHGHTRANVCRDALSEETGPPPIRD